MKIIRTEYLQAGEYIIKAGDDTMRALGIILAGGNNNRMRELSNKRAIAAMPIAGSYRCIDFALSNMSEFSYSESCGVDAV